MPSVSLLPQLLKQKKVVMNENLFYEMSETAMVRIRLKIGDEREAALRKLKRKGK